MRRRTALTAIALIGSLTLAACSGGRTPSVEGPVELTMCSWASLQKVADIWNADHPDIKVTMREQGGGDELVTKVITAAKAGEGPDLVQAEYQMIPTLVSNDVLADITEFAGGAKDKFAENVWKQVTLDSAAYAIPQDTAPLAFYYREDLFTRLGFAVPTTWTEFADVARQVKQKDPNRALTTFSSNDAGLFAGLTQQAGATWWSAAGDTWKVAVDAEASRKVAAFWGDLVDLAGTYWSVLLPGILSPYGIYLARVYAAAAVPDEVLEAARVDGARDLRLFTSIALPMMRPGLVTIFLFQFVAIWNNFLLPYVMLSDDETFPVTVGLYSLLQQGASKPALYTLVITGALLSIIPLIALFLGLQRYWRVDLLSGAVKS